MGTVAMMNLLALVGLLAPCVVGQVPPQPLPRALCLMEEEKGSFYDFSELNLWKNETIDFSQYKGKVVLAYNIASG